MTDSTDPVDAAWKRVEANWDDDNAHSAFIALCVQLGRLPEAGGNYRAVKESEPERADEAQRRIDKLVGFAMATMQQQRTVPDPRPRRVLLMVAVVMFVGAIILAGWTMTNMRP